MDLAGKDHWLVGLTGRHIGTFPGFDCSHWTVANDPVNDCMSKEKGPCYDSPKFDLLFSGSEVQEGLQENKEAVSLHYLREPPGVLKCKKSPFHSPTLLLQSN